VAEWAWQIARQVSGDEEPDELTLDRLLAAEPDAWDSMFVVSTVPRVPIEGGRMPKGVPTTNEEIALLSRAVGVAGSINEFARQHVQDDRSDLAVAQSARKMLKGGSATEPGRSRILAAAERLLDRSLEGRKLVEEAPPEVIEHEGEPYVKADREELEATETPPMPSEMVPTLKSEHLITRDACDELLKDLKESLRSVLLAQGTTDEAWAMLDAAKLLLRLER
jgi:hypothetical protein